MSEILSDVEYEVEYSTVSTSGAMLPTLTCRGSIEQYFWAPEYILVKASEDRSVYHVIPKNRILLITKIKTTYIVNEERTFVQLAEAMQE